MILFHDLKEKKNRTYNKLFQIYYVCGYKKFLIYDPRISRVKIDIMFSLSGNFIMFKYVAIERFSIYENVKYQKTF